MARNNIVKTDGSIDYNYLGTMDDNVTANIAQLAKLVNANTVNLSYYSSYKSGSDWIPAFTRAFSDLTAVGGGVLQVPPAIYTTYSTLKIPAGVRVVGAGMELAIIQLADGADCDVVSLGTNSNCGISHVSIKGNRWGSNPANNRIGLVLGKPGLDYTANNNGTMDNLTVNDIEIRDVAGHGLYSYKATWVYFISRVFIRYCTLNGAYIESTDNSYDSFYIQSCDKQGLYVTGSNNRFSNMKIIFNGKANTGTDIDRAGVYDNGKRNVFAAVECQENYGHGFVFDGATDTDLVGVLADANGYAMIANSTSATASGFLFKNNCQRISGTIKATNFKPTISQFNGYNVDATCSNIALDYENDLTGANDVNNSSTVIFTTAQKKIALYNSTAWDNWTPTLTWTTATPVGITYVAKRKIIGKTVVFSLIINSTDGNGATGLTITLPSDMLPKTNNLSTPFYNTAIVGATTNVRQVSLRDDGTHNDMTYGYMGTATAGQTFKLCINGTYELA